MLRELDCQVNHTVIERYKNSQCYDYILIGSSPAINITLARCISDKGYSVCAITKEDQIHGFEELFNSVGFLQFLSKELGIVIPRVMSCLDYINFLMKFSSKRELITYIGDSYHVSDFGYDGQFNFFLVYPSSVKGKSLEEKVIYSNLNNIEPWFIKFLPKGMKRKQIIGDNMLITHRHSFVKGWGTNTEGEYIKFITVRPNVIPLLSASCTLSEVNNEKKAQQKLFEEVNQLKLFLDSLQDKGAPP